MKVYIMDMVRSVFYLIDMMVYNLIATVYDLIRTVSSLEFFTDENMRNFAQNIYTIIGVFMIFRLAFSIIKYISNPDEFYDKAKGMSQLITRVIVVLFLIVIIPVAFEYGYELQNQIVNKAIIERLILGSDGENVVEGSVGKEMANITLRPFLKCGEDGNSTNCGYYGDNITASNMIKININEGPIGIPGTYLQWGDYYYNYTFLVSTVAGITTLFLLITFLYDMAIRIFKLGFLQLISPVAIISYIDPKNNFSSSGGITGKWLKQVISTYLALFVRLLTIAFLVYIISLIKNNIDYIENSLLTFFLIMGALMFAKEAPKLIGDMFGVDMSANLGGLKALNPLNRMMGGALIGGAAGLAVGTAAGLGFGFANLRKGGTLASGFRQGFQYGRHPIKSGVGDIKKTWEEKDKARNEAQIAERQMERVAQAVRPSGPGLAAILENNDVRTAFTDHETAKGAKRAAVAAQITAQNDLTRNQNNVAKYRNDLLAKQNEILITQQKITDTRGQLEKSSNLLKIAVERRDKANVDLADIRSKIAVETDATVLAKLKVDETKVMADLGSARRDVMTYNTEVTNQQTTMTNLNTTMSAATTMEQVIKTNLSTAESQTSNLVTAVNTAQANVKSAESREENAKAKLESETVKNETDKKTIETYNKGKSQGRF